MFKISLPVAVEVSTVSEPKDRLTRPGSIGTMWKRRRARRDVEASDPSGRVLTGKLECSMYGCTSGLDHIVVLQWGGHGPEGAIGIHIHEELHRSSSYYGELRLTISRDCMSVTTETSCSPYGPPA